MRGNQTRLELFIDVLDLRDQRALAEPGLTATDLIAAILEEFRELEHLSNTPGDYWLLKAEGRLPLAGAVPIGQQVVGKEHLVLTEAEPPVPAGARRPAKQAYLREDATGRVYKVHWYPAIIGRPDVSSPQSDRIAINLADHQQGLRVSRRHAQISEDAGRHYIESLSQNKTTIEDNAGVRTLLGSGKHPLEHGNTIHLDESHIALKFIVLGEEGAG